MSDMPSWARRPARVSEMAQRDPNGPKVGRVWGLAEQNLGCPVVRWLGACGLRPAGSEARLHRNCCGDVFRASHLCCAVGQRQQQSGAGAVADVAIAESKALGVGGATTVNS